MGGKGKVSQWRVEGRTREGRWRKSRRGERRWAGGQGEQGSKRWRWLAHFWGTCLAPKMVGQLARVRGWGVGRGDQRGRADRGGGGGKAAWGERCGGRGPAGVPKRSGVRELGRRCKREPEGRCRVAAAADDA